VSVFRELFVELSEEAFRIAKGVAEQAVTNAQSVQERAATIQSVTLSAAIRSETIGRALCERYGWRNCEVVRSAAKRAFEIGARRLCGHRVFYELNEHALLIGTWTDVIEQAVYETPRYCYCKQREDA
jgi:hypothetical protein